MTSSLRIAAVMVITAALSAGCLDFSPPTAEVSGSPTRTPTSTYTPEPTATVATPTPTSTSTPEPTETGTPTPFNPFATTTVTAGFGLATPPIGLGTPFPGSAGTGALTGSPGGSPVLPPVSSNLPPPPSGGTTGGVSSEAPAATAVSWTCNGDERMQFVPETPSVNDDLLITVTSASDHGYTLLAGAKPLEKVGQGRGGPGYYWQWKRTMDKAGPYHFEFFAGPRPESRCVSGDVFVIAGGPPPTATTVPALAPTATPTRTPRPDN